jgi:hypothetical protein
LFLSTGNTPGNTFAQIRGDNEAGIRIKGGGSFEGGTIELGGGLRNTDPGTIKFSTGTSSGTSTERARIDSSGRLLVGTSSSSQVGGGLDAALQVESTSQAGSRFSILRRNSNNAGPVIALGKTGGSGNEVVLADDALGTIDFSGGDGTDVATSAARIRAEVDGTPGANDMPGRLVFSTTSDGASSPTERLRITSAGNVGIGTTSPGQLLQVGSSNGELRIGAGAGLDITHNNSGSTTAEIKQLYAATSADAQLKIISGFTSFHTGTSGTERARIDSSGNVGIGTTAPDGRFHSFVGSAGSVTASINANAGVFEADGSNGISLLVPDGSVGSIFWGSPSSNRFAEINCGYTNNTFQLGTRRTGGQLIFYTDNFSERFRCDSSGRLLVGTSTAYNEYNGSNSGWDGGAYFSQLSGYGTAHFTDWESGVGKDVYGGNTIYISRCKSGSVGSHTSGALSNGNPIGRIIFNASDGSNFRSSAWIEAAVDGVSGTADVPGRLVFSTTSDGASSPTERLRITSAGNVGIGTTAPTEKLHIHSTGNNPAYLRSTNDGTGTGTTDGIIIGMGDATNAYLWNYENGGIVFATNATQRAAIDSSGRLLVGTSSAINSNYGGTGGLLQVAKNGYLPIGFYTFDNSPGETGYCPYVELHRARGTQASPTIVSSDDDLGLVNFYGHDGSTFIRSALIKAVVDGTPGTNDMPGRLVFSTTADGASSPTERMRISNDGTVLISCTSFPSATVKGVGWANNSGVGYFYSSAVSITGSSTHAQFINPNGIVGSITTDASATAYNTSSDYRLKENVTPVSDGITRLQQLKPSRFNFIADPDSVVDGFLAHEVQTIVPEAIAGEKDAVDEDGNPQYQGIDQSKLVPLLTAALQEAIGRIETLEAEVAALKAQ